MKFNKWTLGLAAVAAISAIALVHVVQKATTGVANGKEVAGIAGNELVVAESAQMDIGQIGQLDAAQFAIVKEYAASVDAANAFANAPNTATSDQVAARAAMVTDQLALKCLTATALCAYTATGAAQFGSS